MDSTFDTQKRSFQVLSTSERKFIQKSLSANPPLSMRQIAAELGRAPSTVTREIKRQGLKPESATAYNARDAHSRAKARASQSTRPRKLENPELQAIVIQLLNEGLTPERIMNELKKKYPNRPEMQVSHETIYRELSKKEKGALKPKLLKRKITVRAR